MMRRTRRLLWWGGIIVVVGALITLGVVNAKKPGKYDGFAQCLKDKKLSFYGAFWCPHCQEQKRMFGKSAKLLPYIECSTADGQGQLQICIDKKIEGYPTWYYADGTHESGVLSFEKLADKSGCTLP